MKQAMIDFIKKGPQDECFTPLYAVRPLLDFIPKHVKKVLECCDTRGVSTITSACIERGFDVQGMDINRGENILDPRFTTDADAIITNPPYSLKDEFIERMIQIGKPWALLLPLTALEGVFRGSLFRDLRDQLRLLIFDRRLQFLHGDLTPMKDANWFGSAWFTYAFDLPWQLTFHQLEKA